MSEISGNTRSAKRAIDSTISVGPTELHRFSEVLEASAEAARKTMKARLVLIVLCALIVGGAPVLSEAREDLVINEISPVAPDNGFAWIELYNRGTDHISLAGVVVEAEEGLPYVVPASWPSLRSGGYLLIRFGPVPSGPPAAPGPLHLIEVTVPERFATEWSPTRGELVVHRSSLTVPGERELVDYLAWGEPGGAWGDRPDRLARWPETSFVPLAGGFGVYDLETAIDEGASIGLYPGSVTSTAEDWAIYDQDETSPGAENHVPRPKTFTLTHGANIGSQSFAVGWARRKGDKWFRFQLAEVEDFRSVIMDERLVTPVIRIGEALDGGDYFYRVMAYSENRSSAYSRAMQVSLSLAGACDWPMPPSPWLWPPGSLWWNPVHRWLKNPGCRDLPKCEILPSIEFRFQRKDTHLVCLSCSSAPSVCSWNQPGWYSQQVCFSEATGRPCYQIAAGGDISKNCARTEYLGMYGAGAVGWPVSSYQCLHGNDYCVMASLSMMASAYRTCLSQDRIAFATFPDRSNHKGELIHGKSPSGGPPGGPPQGSKCTEAMKWALGIPDTGFVYNPNPLPGPADPSFIAAYLTPDYWEDPPPPTIDFDTVRAWIDAGRPLMSKLPAGHMRVVAGYCEEESSDTKWLYVFDPKTGPSAEQFESWYASSDGIWVGPMAGAWPHNSTLDTVNAVRSDEIGVWSDWDNDGLVDFDETRRFGLCPWRPDTGYDAAILGGSAVTDADPCDSE